MSGQKRGAAGELTGVVTRGVRNPSEDAYSEYTGPLVI